MTKTTMAAFQQGPHTFKLVRDTSISSKPHYTAKFFTNGKYHGESTDYGEWPDHQDVLHTGMTILRGYAKSTGHDNLPVIPTVKRTFQNLEESVEALEPKENGTHQRKFYAAIDKIKNAGHKIYQMADFTKNGHFFTSISYGDRGQYKEIIKTPIHLDEMVQLKEDSIEDEKNKIRQETYHWSPQQHLALVQKIEDHWFNSPIDRRPPYNVWDIGGRARFHSELAAEKHNKKFGLKESENYTKIPKVSNLYEAYAKVYAQDTLGVDVENLEESRTTGTRRNSGRGRVKSHNFAKIPTYGYTPDGDVVQGDDRSVYDYTQTATLPDGRRSKVRHGDVLKNLPGGGKGVMYSAWPVRITGGEGKGGLERVAGYTGQTSDIDKLVGGKYGIKKKDAMRFRQTMEEMIKVPPKEGTAEWHREQSRKPIPPGGYVGGKDPRIKDREWHRDEAERLEIEERRKNGYNDLHKRPFDHIMLSVKENWDDDREMMRDIRHAQMTLKNIRDDHYAKADAAFKAYNELKARPSHTRKSREAMDYYGQKYQYHHYKAQEAAERMQPRTRSSYPNGYYEGENRD